jgi:hypothetical protein
MKRILPAATALMTFAVLLASACGGSAGEAPPISVLDLAAIGLPTQQIVIDDTPLPFSGSESGQIERDELLDGSFDPERDSAELEQYGWRGGRDQVFLRTAHNGTGVFLASATLHLADTAEHASQIVDVQVADVLADIGKSSVDSEGTDLKLTSAAAFTSEVDGARGITATIDVDGTPVYFTTISFAREQIVAMMTTASFDDRDLGKTTQDLARQLDEQVRKVVRYP